MFCMIQLWLPWLVALRASAGASDTFHCTDSDASCAAGRGVQPEESNIEELRVELLQASHKHAQGPGPTRPPPLEAPPDSRLVKSTMAVSKRSINISYAWKRANLKVEDSGEPVPDEMCGQPARVTMMLEDNEEFGIHGVYAEGKNNDRDGLYGITVEEVEDIFTEELGDFSKYNPWMDIHFSFYDADIDHYAKAWPLSGAKFLAIAWEALGWPNTTTHYSFYSLITHIPYTQEVFEVVSLNRPVEVEHFERHPMPRHFFTEADIKRFSIMGKDAGPQPLAVSRSTRDLRRTIDFYKEMFHIDPLSTFYDNERDTGYVFFQHSSEIPPPWRQVHYWYRGDQRALGHSTHWLEEKIEKINEDHMMGGQFKCWPVWGDNHYTIKEPAPGFFKNLTERYLAKGWGFKLFREGSHSATPSWTPEKENNTYAAYFPLPGGMYIEVHDETVTAPDADEFPTDYCYAFTCG